MTSCLDRVGWGWAVAGGLIFIGGCVHDAPDDVLHAYVRALRDHREADVRTLSDELSRGLWAEGSVQQTEQDWEAVAQRLDRRVVGRLERTELRLEGGQVVVLVREAGRWRVAEGGLDFARTDTPEAAFATFMVAFDARRLDVIRRLIPRRFVASYADDALLADHLDAMAARIDAARPALKAGSATVDGDFARIPYGQGRAVELIRQDGAWRVLDVD